jgi:uncharacterized iron-regulated protein
MPLFRAILCRPSLCCAAALILELLNTALAAAELPPLPPVPPAEAPLDRTHPLVGTVVGTDGRLSPAQFIARAQDRDFVLLGEKHDNPDHHRLQAWVIDALVAAGKRPSIAMEMLDTEQSAALDAYRRKPDADAAGLGPALGWEKRGWPRWSLYAPIAEIALRAELPILPANITRAETRAIGRGGRDALTPELGAALAISPRYDAAQSASLTDELRTDHCDQLPEAALPRMAEVQWARDASMARTLAATVGPSVLIAGAGHIRNDRAIPWHLRHIAPGRSMLSVAFVEVRPGRTNPTDYSQSGLFDVLWFTARVDDEDPCVKFRDSLQRRRQP